MFTLDAFQYFTNIRDAKFGVGMINATKETYYLLTRLLTLISHFEHSSGCHFQKRFNSIGHILPLCRHFLANANDKEASNDGRQQ